MTQATATAARITRPWDPVVRLAHWGVAVAILMNGLLLEEGSALHQWLGYGAAALLAMRLLWGFVGPAEARFGAFPPRPLAALRHLGGLIAGRDQPHASHNPLGALMVYALWLTLAVVIGTGMAMADPPWLAQGASGGEARAGMGSDEGPETEGDEEGDERSTRSDGLPAILGRASVESDEVEGTEGEGDEILEEAHEIAANLLMLLAALHVAGVAVQSRVSRGREFRRMVGVGQPDA